MTEHDKLASLLFPKGEGETLSNFKLLRMNGDVVSPAFVREQVHSALVQAWVSKRADTRFDFPPSGAKTIDVAEMVERL